MSSYHILNIWIWWINLNNIENIDRKRLIKWWYLKIKIDIWIKLKKNN